MEVLLGKLTQQAMNHAIRAGITITSTYALRQCGRLMKTVDGKEKDELATLRRRLESKIEILSPAINMIELVAARGNTTLEPTVALTTSLRYDIQALGVRLSKAVGEEQLARQGSSRSQSRAMNDLELKLIIADLKKLLDRIEDSVQYINVAMITSGVSLSASLPATVSPSRMLQASTFLTAGDTQYCMSLPRAQQIGPVFTLSMYMLFSGHANRPLDEENIRATTWKEVMHKARVKLMRVPLEHVYDFPSPFEGSTSEGKAEQDYIPSESKLYEFAYQLLIVEDLDDDRFHEFDDNEAQPGPYEGVNLAGTREVIPIHEISKIFYADTGKILNIGTDGETNNPILLLKRDINAVPPRRMVDQSAPEQDYDSDDSQTVGGSDVEDEQSELDAQLRRESTADLLEEPMAENQGQLHPWRLPPNLDLEWVAFEVYTEEPTSESELDDLETETNLSQSPTPNHADAISPGLSTAFSKIDLRPTTPTTPTPPNTQLIPSPQKAPAPRLHEVPQPTSLPAIKTSLSLLEMLIRLTALQQFQQCSHLAIQDELLNFFLSDSSTVGAGADSELRRRKRREARARLGFDPYDESPIKRRGEEYLEHEFHDGGYADASPTENKHYDYDGFPHGKASTVYSPRSRSSTPLRSSPFPGSSPVIGGKSKSSADVPLPSREGRAQFPTLSSASPLLRRATTQPSQSRGFKQPSFRGPPTAPPTSSSPRLHGQHIAGSQQQERGSQVPDTPPSSIGKRD